jgi:hypothetical protein
MLFNDLMRQEFVREADFAGRLCHKNFVTTIGVCFDWERPILCMGMDDDGY